MIEPKDYEHAKRCARLSGPTSEAAFAFIDGYLGRNNEASKMPHDRDFYVKYWILGAECREKTATASASDD